MPKSGCEQPNLLPLRKWGTYCTLCAAVVDERTGITKCFTVKNTKSLKDQIVWDMLRINAFIFCCNSWFKIIVFIFILFFYIQIVKMLFSYISMLPSHRVFLFDWLSVFLECQCFSATLLWSMLSALQVPVIKDKSGKICSI